MFVNSIIIEIFEKINLNFKKCSWISENVDEFGKGKNENEKRKEKERKEKERTKMKKARKGRKKKIKSIKNTVWVGFPKPEMS